MTKNEKILKAQIRELERLVEIKDEVIRELKTLISPNQTIFPTITTSGFSSGEPMPNPFSGTTCDSETLITNTGTDVA